MAKILKRKREKASATVGEVKSFAVLCRQETNFAWTIIQAAENEQLLLQFCVQ